MAATVQVVEVATVPELDTAITSWVVQGYILGNKTANSATMIKKKEFNWIWAVIGFFVCLIPLIIYLMVYAGESDKVVEIRVRNVPEVQEPDLIAELERLKALHEQGALNDEEFAAQKQRILGQMGLGGPTSTQPAEQLPPTG
jgi:hypothetical protein